MNLFNGSNIVIKIITQITIIVVIDPHPKPG